MKKLEMDLIMVGLGAAYPQAFPKTRDELEAVTIVWYADFGFLPADLVQKAAAHMRRRCRWPSIAELWLSVMRLVGLPDYITTRQSIARHLDTGGNKSPGLGVFTQQVFDGFGDAYDHRNADGRHYDVRLRKCYEEMVERWLSQMSQLEYRDLLLDIYNQKQITEGEQP